MTREEEIQQAAMQYAEKEYSKMDYEEKLFSIIDFKAGAEWADKFPKCPWISVEDRLPEKINEFLSVPVLCRYTRGGKVYYHVTQYDYEFDEWSIINVTHWMPIPELPKGCEK